MRASVRPVGPPDVDKLVDLALRAWEPVFISLAEVLGEELDRRLTPDWRSTQEQAVRVACQAEEGEAWVAEVDGSLAGFVFLSIFDTDRGIGQIDMLAVDPFLQGQGVGRFLTEHGIARLRALGMRVAVVETGGDPGHAPARRVYERAGLTKLPIARYFKSL